MAEEYATLPALKLSMNITDSARDTLLQQALTAAARSIDRMCGRRFYLDAAATARTFNPRGRVVCGEGGERLLVDDIGDVTGLTVETGTGGSWAAVSGYETGPENALVRGLPVTALVLPSGVWGYGTTRVRVTAKWGWPAIPDEVVQATLIQASRLFKRKDSPEGVMGSAEWGVVRLSRVDPDVQALVQHLTLPGFG